MFGCVHGSAWFIQPKRDGKDYASISSVTHMLNNTDSVLKKDDVKDAIEDYEELFAGARTEVRARICIPGFALPASFCDHFVSNLLEPWCVCIDESRFCTNLILQPQTNSTRVDEGRTF